MSIGCQCPGCGGKFNAPDNYAGKAVRCPKCKATIQVPVGSAATASAAVAPGAPVAEEAAAQAKASPAVRPNSTDAVAWFLRTTDGQHLGPMPRTDVDRMVADGKLDGLCQIRRADWEDWQWIEAVYKQFADAGEPKTAPAASAAQEESRLLECPDCAKVVSRRATQCPNCGCPISRISGQPIAKLRDVSGKFASKDAGYPRRKSKKALLIVGALAGVVLLVALPICGFLGWKIWQRMNPVVEPTPTVVQTPPPEPPPVVVEKATPAQIAAWIDEISAEQAKLLDNGYNQLHAAQAGIQAMREVSDLEQSVLSGDFAKPASHDDDKPKRKPLPPYKSQVESLQKECRDYLQKNVDKATASPTTIRELAVRWAESKRTPLQQQVEKSIGLPVAP